MVAVLIFIVMIEKNQLQLVLLDVMKLMSDLRELVMQFLIEACQLDVADLMRKIPDNYHLAESGLVCQLDIANLMRKIPDDYHLAESGLSQHLMIMVMKE